MDSSSLRRQGARLKLRKNSNHQRRSHLKRMGIELCGKPDNSQAHQSHFDSIMIQHQTREDDATRPMQDTD